MLKVLHLTTGLDNGGAEAILFRLVKKSHRFKHVVVSFKDEGFYGEKLRAANIELHCLNMPRGRITLSGIFRLVKIIWMSRTDIIQTWMYHADIIGGVLAYILGGKKVIWGIHNAYFSEEEKSNTKSLIKFGRLLSNVCPSKIISCSEFAKTEHQKRGYRNSSMISIRNGVDTDLFIPNHKLGLRIRNELKIPENTIVMGMVARWDNSKDHACLLETLGALPRDENWRLLLLGAGINDGNKELLSLIRDNRIQDRVILLGAQENILSFYNAMDIHLLISKGESFGNVTAEAMSCGVPSIMTDVGEARDIIDRHGWIITPGKKSELLDSILDAFTKISSEDLKNNARQRIIQRFSLNRMVYQYEIEWKRLE